MDHIAWLREVVCGPAHLQGLADGLNDGRLLAPDLAPLLADISARGWVSQADVEFARANPGARWAVRQPRPPGADSERGTADG